MFEKIFYFLWITYTALSLSGFAFLFCLGMYAKWENAKHRKKLDEMFAKKSSLEDEGW
jgi:hypothetical protein